MDISQNKIKKLKIGLLNKISSEWFYLYNDRLEWVNHVDDADYIIYESNGDPISVINQIKNTFPKHKLVFILSGDQSAHIDNDCIWFTNAIRSDIGLAQKQTQIFVSNPAIFKFYDSIKTEPFSVRDINIYFKGTIWPGMRSDMYTYFLNKPGCVIKENSKYWDWRFQKKTTHSDIEKTAFDSYQEMINAQLVLCPKGNGNSSMRIVEALGCGAIPILINDFSCPFGLSWSEVGLVFDTTKHSWDFIYSECYNLLKDIERLNKLKLRGKHYFENIIYGDKKIPTHKMYKDINTVCFGFSNIIIENLEKRYLES